MEGLRRITAHLGWPWLASFAVLTILGATQGLRVLGPVSQQPLWISVAAGILLHGSLHECSHALASSWGGVKIRGAGVALLYWVIPVLYVDRTDSYRLADRNSRIGIALAGPVFDAAGCGIAGMLSIIGGTVGTSFAWLSFFQALIFLSNINPLLPSDGYHALEAASGELNVRGRAMQLLLGHLGVRRLPPHLANLSARKKVLYMAYGFAAFVYVAMCLTALLLLVPTIVTAIGEYSR
jgi:putative peptide zinc metalloprotease protein